MRWVNKIATNLIGPNCNKIRAIEAGVDPEPEPDQRLLVQATVTRIAGVNSHNSAHSVLCLAYLKRTEVFVCTQFYPPFSCIVPGSLNCGYLAVGLKCLQWQMERRICWSISQLCQCLCLAKQADPVGITVLCWRWWWWWWWWWWCAQYEWHPLFNWMFQVWPSLPLWQQFSANMCLKEWHNAPKCHIWSTPGVSSQSALNFHSCSFWRYWCLTSGLGWARLIYYCCIRKLPCCVTSISSFNCCVDFRL